MDVVFNGAQTIHYVPDPGRIRDLGPDALGPDGRLRVLPAAWWASTTGPQRLLFGARNGLYGFPTLELVEHLRTLIDGRSAIEIGAGAGVLADALGIPGTDSRQQEITKYRRIYEAQGQRIVPYGPNIIRLDAAAAVARYRPQVVVACWVTHRYDPRRPFDEGNEAGVDEAALLGQVEEYIFIGNTRVHRRKPLWRHAHQVTHPGFVYSRADNGTPDFVAVWKGGRS